MTQSLLFNCRDQNCNSWKIRAQSAACLWNENKLAPLSEKYKIADFGCGNERLRGILSGEIAKDFTYDGFDKFPQKKCTRKIDLEDVLPHVNFDVIFCLGLLEYIRSIPALFNRMSRISRQVVVSYVVSDSQTYSDQAVRDRGWLSHYSTSEFEDLFKASNFKIQKRKAIDRGKTVLWLLKNRVLD